ncbi:hypothetical protein [Bradyrhizobium yuanmingense]|uniref:hypothetical protein n=1 Tax=Bradyrhizobium yuanmingense TaxID=108015 RepID=UPI0035135B5A
MSKAKKRLSNFAKSSLDCVDPFTFTLPLAMRRQVLFGALMPNGQTFGDFTKADCETFFTMWEDLEVTLIERLGPDETIREKEVIRCVQKHYPATARRVIKAWFITFRPNLFFALLADLTNSLTKAK